MKIYEKIYLGYDWYYMRYPSNYKNIVNTIEIIDYVYDDKERLVKTTSEDYSIALNMINYEETIYNITKGTIKGRKFDQRKATEEEKRRFYKAWHKEIVRRIKEKDL